MGVDGEGGSQEERWWLANEGARMKAVEPSKGSAKRK